MKYFNDGFFFHKRDVYRHIKKSIAAVAATVLCFQGASAVPGLSGLMGISGITDYEVPQQAVRRLRFLLQEQEWILGTIKHT